MTITTRRQAEAEARRRWTSRMSEERASVGDRLANVVVRQKKVIKRYEVGYWRITALGYRTSYEVVTMGVGATWSEAFEVSDRRSDDLNATGLTP